MLRLYEATAFAIFKYYQTSEEIEHTFSPDCNLKNFLKTTLANNKELEQAVRGALDTQGKNLDDLYHLEEQMVSNQVKSKYRETSLNIKFTDGAKISNYGLLLNHVNSNTETFELCN